MANAIVPSVMGLAITYLDSEQFENYEMLSGEVALIVRETTETAITTQQQANRIADLLSRGAAAASALEAKRKVVLAPFKSQIADINRLFDALTDSLEDLSMKGKSRIAAWKKQEKDRVERERAEKQREMEEAARKQREAEARAAAAKTTEERKKALADAAAASQEISEAEITMPRDTPKHIRTESGSIIAKERWTFEVVDAALVPRTFCAPSHDAIRAAVKAGVREIPGVHIYPTEDLAVNPGR
jgi:hypothetical protein